MNINHNVIKQKEFLIKQREENLIFKYKNHLFKATESFYSFITLLNQPITLVDLTQSPVTLSQEELKELSSLILNQILKSNTHYKNAIEELKNSL